MKKLKWILLLPVLLIPAGLYWKLVMYHGFPAPPEMTAPVLRNLCGMTIDGESAYDCILLDLYLILCVICAAVSLCFRIKKKADHTKKAA